MLSPSHSWQLLKARYSDTFAPAPNTGHYMHKHIPVLILTRDRQAKKIFTPNVDSGGSLQANREFIFLVANQPFMWQQQIWSYVDDDVGDYADDMKTMTITITIVG